MIINIMTIVTLIINICNINFICDTRAFVIVNGLGVVGLVDL